MEETASKAREQGETSNGNVNHQGYYAAADRAIKAYTALKALDHLATSPTEIGGKTIQVAPVLYSIKQEFDSAYAKMEELEMGLHRHLGISKVIKGRLKGFPRDHKNLATRLGVKG